MIVPNNKSKLEPQWRHRVVCVWAILAAVVLLRAAPDAHAEDSSTPAMLQMFEAKWDVIEDRMADIFVAGYGRMWLPPPARADSGGLSVGYDVFDRFDLGSPRNETLYGTETGLKTLIGQAHRAGIKINTDFIPNHNGFSDSSTFDNQGTPDDASDDVFWDESGGYPGFVTTLSAEEDPNGVGDIDGDFHSAFATGELFFRLSGLIDIAQDKNHQFIRSPVDPSDPRNIPAGTEGIFGRGPANVPDPNNARFYADQDLGGTTVFDSRLNTNVTLYDFNTDTPLAGDAVLENATGLLIRNIRWMIQEVGVDGFRIDAGRHFPRWVMNYLDQGAFLAKKEPLLDGSPDHVYSFTEVGFDSLAFQQDFIRKDIDNGDLTQLGGNRDALDFNFFGAVKSNLSANGLANDWRDVKNKSIDVNDDGLANNGSQGVAFVQSHDDGPAFLNNVAHAYMLMRPGNALVYLNGKQFGEGRSFPEDGRGDALGGLYGDAVTKLVGLRNSHGRGNYQDRTPNGDEKEMLIYEREKSALVVLSNRLDGGFDARTVQTSFAPGTPLIELTGNAADSTIDPQNDFPELLIVNGNGTVDLRVPRNVAPGAGGEQHNSGYLIYGVSGPQGQMRLTDTAGNDLTNVLAGSTPVAGQGGPNGPSDDFFNGITRLTDITVVNEDSFKLRIETNAVNLLGTHRDCDADGDRAQFMIDDGLDANGNGNVDHVTPGSVSYGFEDFTETNMPGFFEASGDGLYEQTIDASELAEGRHYLTGRVFRHRATATGGDGGPAVFTDFRQVIYVDRLAPEAEIVSFEPFASDPTNTSNRDLIVQSTDGTADNMHLFLNLGADLTDAQIIQMAENGQGSAGQYDRDQWISGQFGVGTGNHAVTVVTIEPTGTTNVQRFAGIAITTNLGAGLGDVDSDGAYEVSDMIGFVSMKRFLEADNQVFNAAADVTADGRIDNRDLFALEPILIDAGVSAAVLDAYDGVLLSRGDVDDDALTDAKDLAALYAGLGGSDTTLDLNVDGSIDSTDIATFFTQVLRSTPGDFNLDGRVDAADYTVWRDSLGATSGTGLAADGDFSGTVDQQDYQVWRAAFGFVRQPLTAMGMGNSVIPEPTSIALVIASLFMFAVRRKKHR